MARSRTTSISMTMDIGTPFSIASLGVFAELEIEIGVEPVHAFYEARARIYDAKQAFFGSGVGFGSVVGGRCGRLAGVFCLRLWHQCRLCPHCFEWRQRCERKRD